MRARISTISGESLLLVHGRGFKPPEDVLFDLSVAGLRAGLKRDYPDRKNRFDDVSKHIAYYGDLSNAYLQGLDLSYDEALDVGDRENALTELRKIELRKKFGIRQYDCCPGKSAVPEFLANFIAPICGLLGLTRTLVKGVSPDFAHYLEGNNDYAAAARERIRTRLCELLESDDRIMLISHGTGCVLVYDVLWQLSHDERFIERYGDRKVDTWITMGAPLGDNSIRKFLHGTTGEKVSYPRNVINWHNVAAEDDYTCHDGTLADDFKPMMEDQAVSVVHDYRVYNLAVRYGRSNPHSSIGYFIHPRISKIVADWLQSPAIDTDPVYTI